MPAARIMVTAGALLIYIGIVILVWNLNCKCEMYSIVPNFVLACMVW